MAQMIKMPKPNIFRSDAIDNIEISPVSGNNNVDNNKTERLAREINEITALYNMAVAVGSSLDLRKVVRTLYKESSRLINAANFALVIYDPDLKALNYALVVEQNKQMKPLSVRISRHHGLTGQVLITQAPFLVHDLLEIQKSQNIVEVNRFCSDRQIRSWLGVPILNPLLPNENAQGVISIWSYEPSAFNDHDLWLLSAIATQAAIAIRNARLYESSQRRAAEMVFLNDVVGTLSSTLHLDQVLTRIMEQVERLLNVEAGSLLLADPPTGDLVFQIALGDKATEVKPFRIPKGQGIAGDVAGTGKPLIIADVKKDKRHFKKLDQTVDFFTRNILCVPLILHDTVIGVLEVMNKKAGNFTQDDAALLSSIASYAAIAIDNARLHESVLAERDKVIEAEEEARKELARDLHDGPTQWVSSILMSVDFSQRALVKDPDNAIQYLTKELANIAELGKRSVEQLRTALFELRPLVLETQGLEAALDVFLERRQKDLSGKTKLTLKVETDNPHGNITRQDPKVEGTIFSIVQETVNNALKHAQADNVVVELKETIQAIYTVIKDDGKGFDVEQVMKNYEKRGSLGMVNLRERAELIGGELTMRSAPGHGTRITVFVPKEKEERMKKRSVTGTLSLPPDMIPT
jgi:signal transduction histidine kinase